MVDRSVTFVGTATTVLRLGGLTILTDPNFLHRGQRAYLGYGLSSRRRTEPALQPDQLPPLDAVVLSHLHGDHFDRVARAGLARDVPVLTTGQAARKLRRWGFGACQPLAPWSGTELVSSGEETLRVTAVPGRHGPGLLDSLLPDVIGTVLEHRTGGGPPFRLYITGDVLFRTDLARVTERFGPPDAMLAHLGGTRILGALLTMDARQGADLVQLLRPALTIPVHYDDYPVFRSPLRDFLTEWRSRPMPGRVRPVRRGETVILDADVDAAPATGPRPGTPPY